jgi:hypothetical protein
MTASEVLDADFSSTEINEVADWLNDLSFEQLIFLKQSYEAMLKFQAQACGSEYVQ